MYIYIYVPFLKQTLSIHRSAQIDAYVTLLLSLYIYIYNHIYIHTHIFLIHTYIDAYPHIIYYIYKYIYTLPNKLTQIQKVHVENPWFPEDLIYTFWDSPASPLPVRGGRNPPTTRHGPKRCRSQPLSKKVSWCRRIYSTLWLIMVGIMIIVIVSNE